MARIRCHYLDCVFLDDGMCSAAAVEIDPDAGCMTFSPSAESSAEGDWDDDEELEEWEELDGDGDDDDELWLDEEEESY